MYLEKNIDPANCLPTTLGLALPGNILVMLFRIKMRLEGRQVVQTLRDLVLLLPGPLPLPSYGRG